MSSAETALKVGVFTIFLVVVLIVVVMPILLKMKYNISSSGNFMLTYNLDSHKVIVMRTSEEGLGREWTGNVRIIFVFDRGLYSIISDDLKNKIKELSTEHNDICNPPEDVLQGENYFGYSNPPPDGKIYLLGCRLIADNKIVCDPSCKVLASERSPVICDMNVEKMYKFLNSVIVCEEKMQKVVENGKIVEKREFIPTYLLQIR